MFNLWGDDQKIPVSRPEEGIEEEKIDSNTELITTAGQDNVGNINNGDNLPDNWGFESSNGISVQNTGVSVEIQKEEVRFNSN